jgi:predicted  nucleic acid-binding Zn-ribbon protein
MYVNNIRKLIQISWIIIMISALLIGGMLIREKHEHKADLDEMRILNESLLSEKLALDKEIVHYKDALDDLEGKNEQTNKLLAEVQRKLKDREMAYSKILRANAQSKRLERQLVDIEEIKEGLLDEVNDFNQENTKLP